MELTEMLGGIITVLFVRGYDIGFEPLCQGFVPTRWEIEFCS